MDSIFERLLLLATPLLTATSAKKKQTSKKHAQVKKPTKRVHKPAKSARPKKPKSIRKPVKSAQRAKSARPIKPGKFASAKTPPGKVIPGKPTPKFTVPTSLTKAPPKPPPPPPKPEPPLGRPRLLSPENGKFSDNVAPTFRWLSVGGAKRYEVYWSPDPNLSSGHSMLSTATEATIPPDRPLTIGLTYYWRVRGGNEAGWGPWSAPASFSVLEEAV